MRRSYGYTPRQNSGWETTSQDYHAHLSRMERMPTMIPGASQYPTVHKAFNNYNSEEEVEFLHQHKRWSPKSHKKPPPKSDKKRSPKSDKKKVHVAEHVETTEESRDGNCEVSEETAVHAEADGYLQSALAFGSMLHVNHMIK